MKNLIHYNRKIFFIFLILLIITIYSNTLHSPFYFDSENIELFGEILKNYTIEELIKATFLVPHRPIANITFILNYCFHKLNVFGYHSVNIIIHIINALLLFNFVKLTLILNKNQITRANNENRSIHIISKDESIFVISLLTATLWAVHPIQIQSVTYIVQRMNSLSAMFCLMAFLFYIKGRMLQMKPLKNKAFPLFILSFVSVCLAIGSKENAAILPLFIALYEWYFFQDLNWTWVRQNKRVIFAIPFIIIILGLIYLRFDPVTRILAAYQHRDFSISERCLTQFRVVLFYLSLFFYPNPIRLNLDHHYIISKSLIQPFSTLVAMIVIIGLLILAGSIAKRNRIISFCILWYFGNLVIESSIIGLEIIFEHRVYLPSMLVSLAMVTIAYQRIRSQRLIVLIFLIIISIFSTWTYIRNEVWKNEISLWEDCVVKSPDKARPNFNLGLAYASQKRHKESIFHYRKALNIDPYFENGNYALGESLNQLGMIDEAILHYQKELVINPKNIDTYNSLGLILVEHHRIEEALKYYHKAIELDPFNKKLHNNLGLAYYAQKNFDKAMIHYKKALMIEPNYKDSHYNLALLFQESGEIDLAIEHYLAALKSDNQFEYSHLNLADIYYKRGNINDSANHYLAAIAINPELSMTYHKIGYIELNHGDIQKAISYFSEAIHKESNNAEAHIGLGICMARLKQYEKAIEHFKNALTLQPNNAHIEHLLNMAIEDHKEK